MTVKSLNGHLKSCQKLNIFLIILIIETYNIFDEIQHIGFIVEAGVEG